MSILRIAALAVFCLVLAPSPQSRAHDSAGHGAATPPNPAPTPESTAAEIRVVRLTQPVDPEAAEAPVLQVPRGAHVHLTLIGAGAAALHLHGHDISVTGERNMPAVFDFDASHSGRFPVEMHLEGDIFGRTEKAILYIEVREP